MSLTIEACGVGGTVDAPAQSGGVRASGEGACAGGHPEGDCPLIPVCEGFVSRNYFPYCRLHQPFETDVPIYGIPEKQLPVIGS